MFAERNVEDANVDRMAGAGKAGGMNDAYYFAYLRQRLQDQGLGRLATLLTRTNRDLAPLLMVHAHRGAVRDD